MQFGIRNLVRITLISAGLILGAMPATVLGQGGNSAGSVIVSGPVVPKISPALRSLPQSNSDSRQANTEAKPAPPTTGSLNGVTTPSPTLNFEGQSGSTIFPPDTSGDVGPDHYVQVVNMNVAIYNKSGTLLGSWPTNTLWTGFGGPCETRNDGMAVVLFDDMANRWLITQYAIDTAGVQCVAVSVTPDPEGSYYQYAFPMPQFPDYPKFGIWPDGYYFGTNSGYVNNYYAHVLDRNSMLAGNAATMQSFGGNANFLMPADADGATSPPANSPGYFYTFYKNGYADHPPGPDRLAIYEFDVDWAVPANSTFTLATELPITAFNYTVCGIWQMDCIPQPGTSVKIDSLSNWPMPRLQYRNFGSYAAMVGNFTVDLDNTDTAAIRWFELRKTGADPWTLYQEGTYSPDSDHRFNGSIAMDAQGNIALEYTVSSATTYPSIRYAVRTPTDPPGTLRAEATLIDGTGSQTGSSSRWGDASAMSVDPTVNCTFWMTNEYHLVNNIGSFWHTRIGTVAMPDCSSAVSTVSFPWPTFLPSIIKSSRP